MKNMGESKELTITLEEGERGGIVKCEFSQESYLFYKIPLGVGVPKNLVMEYAEREDLENWGIYFLLGVDDDENGIFYVGQAETRKNDKGPLNRIFEHYREKKYFSEAIIITRAGKTFDEPSLKYLENRFYNIAKESRLYIVENGNEPPIGNLSETGKRKLDRIIEDVKIVMGLFGYPVFSDSGRPSDSSKRSHLVLYLEHRGGTASCVKTETEFIIQEKSDIVENHVPSAPSHIKRIRDQAKEDKQIVNGKLKKEYRFKSPSAAAAFVTGQSIDGREYWKDSNGVSLKKLEGL